MLRPYALVGERVGDGARGRGETPGAVLSSRPKSCDPTPVAAARRERMVLCELGGSELRNVRLRPRAALKHGDARSSPAASGWHFTFLAPACAQLAV